jgi:hypothetical protein
LSGTGAAPIVSRESLNVKQPRDRSPPWLGVLLRGFQLWDEYGVFDSDDSFLTQVFRVKTLDW